MIKGAIKNPKSVNTEACVEKVRNQWFGYACPFLQVGKLRECRGVWVDTAWSLPTFVFVPMSHNISGAAPL